MEQVSVIVPVYNLQDELEGCLTSLRAQSYPALEIVLVDDGSQDGTLELCRRWAQRDGRIRVLHHDNRGVSYTRNRGLAAATGAYVMFVDGDDRVEPDWVEQYVHAARRSGAQVVLGGLTIHRGQGEEILSPPCTGGRSALQILSALCTDPHPLYGYVPNKLYRRQFLLRHGLRFPEHMAAQEDLRFALECYARAEQVYCLPCAGYHYHCAPRRRQVPLEHLWDNQYTLLCLAQAAQVPPQGVQAQRQRLADMLYTALFWAKDARQVSALKRLPVAQQLLACPQLWHGLGRIAAACLRGGHDGAAYALLRGRREAGQLWGRLRGRQGGGTA